MKGLIYKDAICLKKELKTFILVGLGVMALAVMFALSNSYGNIADGLKNYNDEDTMDKAMLVSMINIAMHIVLFIPIAFIGNIIDCFKSDKKAGFSNVLFSMPVNYKEIVGARYISLMIYGVMGFIFALITGVGVSAASETIKFSEMVSTASCFLGVMIIYMAIVIPAIYAFGAGKSDVICAVPFLTVITGAIAFVICNEDKIPEDEAGFMKLGTDLLKFITQKGGIVIAIGLAMLVLSYILSVVIIKRKRGNGI